MGWKCGEQTTSKCTCTHSTCSKHMGKAAAPKGPDKSKSASLPELKRVIVALGNRIIMEENLERALDMILEEKASFKKLATVPSTKTTAPSAAQTQDIYRLGELALEHYNKAKSYLRQENWAEYGKELEELNKILNEMTVRKQERKQ